MWRRFEYFMYPSFDIDVRGMSIPTVRARRWPSPKKKNANGEHHVVEGEVEDGHNPHGEGMWEMEGNKRMVSRGLTSICDETLYHYTYGAPIGRIVQELAQRIRLGLGSMVDNEVEMVEQDRKSVV